MADLPDIILSGWLPSEEGLNGLPSLAKEVIKDETTKVVAVIVLDCTVIKHRVDTKVNIPQMRIRQLEPIRDAEDLATIRGVVDRARQDRTGAALLPLELADLAHVFGTVDGEPAEIVYPVPAGDDDRPDPAPARAKRPNPLLNRPPRKRATR